MEHHPFLLGKLTISLAIFNRYVSHYQRVSHSDSRRTTGRKRRRSTALEDRCSQLPLCSAFAGLQGCTVGYSHTSAVIMLKCLYRMKASYIYIYVYLYMICMHIYIYNYIYLSIYIYVYIHIIFISSWVTTGSEFWSVGSL